MSVVIDPPRPSSRARSAGSGRRVATNVQVPFIHERRSAQHHFETLAVFTVFALAFGGLGYWLVVDMRVVSFDALDRLTGAYLAWHGAPAKLAAIGFSWPPMQTVALLPFALFSQMATGLVALPVCSALFGGLTMVSLNRVLERCDVAIPLRYPLLVLFAITPTFCFYAASGGAETLGLFPLTAAISALVAWYRTVDTRYLIVASGAFAFAVLANYGDALWLLVGAAMVAAVLSRHGADKSEVEGSLITYLAPAFYAVALWCLCNWLIERSPLGWITNGSGTSVGLVHNLGHSAPAGVILLQCLKLSFAAAPLILVVAPSLVYAAVRQRNELAGWLAGFCLLAILEPGLNALIHRNIATMQLSAAAPQMIVALIGAAWLYQSFERSRLVIGPAVAIAMAVSILVVWHGIGSYPYQNMESAFKTVVSDGGASAPATTVGGRQVGIGQEQSMADYIRTHVHAPESILTDNSQTYGVILFSGEPALFRTRLENGNWYANIARPPRSVKFFLVRRFGREDAVAAAYPGAVQGQRRGLTIVYSNARYALIAVAPGTNVKNSIRRRSSTAGSSGNYPVITLNGL